VREDEDERIPERRSFLWIKWGITPIAEMGPEA
jgi:hypothetical protein